MLKAYDITASWPKAVAPGETGIPPVVSGIPPKTGVPLAPATSGFHLAVARQFPGESGPVRPGQTFEIFKIARHGSDHSGAVSSFFIFHFPFKPVAVRQDRKNGRKALVALPLNSGPSTVRQTQSDPVRPLKFLKSPAPAATTPGAFFHFSFSIFHLEIRGFKVVQGCSRLNFFPPSAGHVLAQPDVFKGLMTGLLGHTHYLKCACHLPGSLFCVVTDFRLGYAGVMLWKKTWELEAVLALLGGILTVFFAGNIGMVLLQHEKVPGFQTSESVGTVLLATLSFHGAALVLGTFFLRFHESSWREVLGTVRWPRCLGLAVVVLAAALPLVMSLELLSETVLARLHWPLEKQAAVELILGAKAWLRVYLAVFTVIVAPVAEEFVFRGLLFSTAKHLGWPKLGWIGVSLLFALFHVNAPIFLPLFVLALALTWLREITGGLLAPMLAHSLFNTVNLVLLFYQI